MKGDLAEAAEAVRLATDKWQDAHNRAETARGDEINALNALNQAQKRLDELLALMRKAAPRDSDWKAAERRKNEFPG